MKKILLATVLAGILSTNLMAGWVTGHIYEMTARADGTMWASMVKSGDVLTNKYKVNATGDALKTMNAVIMTAKAGNMPVRMLWENVSGGVWTRVEFIAR